MLDTSAFIMGFNPSGTEKAYTVPSVENELLPGTMAQLRFRVSKEKRELTVQHPTPRSSATVEEASSLTGEKGFVSEADRDVVALALDLRQSGMDPVIVSDDYAVQNLAEHLQLSYGALANFCIVHKFRWIMYCPACHRRYIQPARTCRFCGSELRRKVLAKTRIGEKPRK